MVHKQHTHSVAGPFCQPGCPPVIPYDGCCCCWLPAMLYPGCCLGTSLGLHTKLKHFVDVKLPCHCSLSKVHLATHVAATHVAATHTHATHAPITTHGHSATLPQVEDWDRDQTQHFADSTVNTKAVVLSCQQNELQYAYSTGPANPSQ